MGDLGNQYWVRKLNVWQTVAQETMAVLAAWLEYLKVCISAGQLFAHCGGPRGQFPHPRLGNPSLNTMTRYTDSL